MTETIQQRFRMRWAHLQDPHVRALAWLLDAPDLLWPNAPQWHGKIATLKPPAGVMDWLAELDRSPDALRDFLALGAFERLGRYAEKLLAFYFKRQGILVGHGVQVRAEKNVTVGEFDFLLNDGGGLLHWEFATKLYLLEGGAGSDFFIGPNRADSLDEKMRKILDRQLALGLHPAAQSHLASPIISAQALIKGWLFYHGDDQPVSALGLHPNHCRGFWCALAEAHSLEAERYIVLPRLGWLAPVQAPAGYGFDKPELLAALSAHFSKEAMPVLVALLQVDGGVAYETARGFVVPDDWRERTGQRGQRAFIASR